MNSLLTVSIVVLFVPACFGQVFKFGSCPDFSLQENFEPAEYFSGKFYEQKRFWAIFEVGSKCVNAEYTVLGDNQVQVNNSAVSEKTGERFAQIGEAYCETDQTAACHVRFYKFQPYGDYNLISADPKKYGLVFSCRQIIPKVLNSQFAWILTRDKQVSQVDMNRYLDIFRQNGVDIDSFIDTVQDCQDN